MKIQAFFKEAYYINLDPRTDRKHFFEGQLKQHGLDSFVVRKSGCIPRLDDVPADDIQKIGYRKHGACGRSHKNIVQYAKDKNLDNILIFEDDAEFYNGGDEPGINLIEKALDTLSTIPDWDIFYMGGIILDEKINTPIGNLLKVDRILTTHAWAINKRCYDNVLKYRPGDGYETEYDSPIDGCLGNNTHLNKYLVYPLACIQGTGMKSDCALRADGEPLYNDSDAREWLKNYNKPLR